MPLGKQPNRADPPERPPTKPHPSDLGVTPRAGTAKTAKAWATCEMPLCTKGLRTIFGRMGATSGGSADLARMEAQ